MGHEIGEHEFIYLRQTLVTEFAKQIPFFKFIDGLRRKYLICPMDNCNQTFDTTESNKEYISHKDSHLAAFIRYKCSHEACNDEFSSREFYFQHLTVKHSGMVCFIKGCLKLGLKFRNPREFKLHMSIHEINSEDLNCDHLGNNEELFNNINSQLGQIPLDSCLAPYNCFNNKCQICDQQLQDAASFQTHMQEHLKNIFGNLEVSETVKQNGSVCSICSLESDKITKHFGALSCRACFTHFNNYKQRPLQYFCMKNGTCPVVRKMNEKALKR